MAKPRLPQPVGRQSDVLYLPAEGHVVVLGTAGSGKTTLAMHRAAYLANGDLPHGGKVLLVCFNNTLLKYFESFQDLDGENVDARTYHRFARGYLSKRGKMSYDSVCGPDQMRWLLEKAVEAERAAAPDDAALARPLGFLLEEIKWLMHHGIDAVADYVNAERVGRHGARLLRTERPSVFALYTRYRQLRAEAGKVYDWEDVATTVLSELGKDDGPRMYKHVVIDEGQDFSPMMLRSLAALVPHDGTLTFFGDNAQQIYGHKLSWRSAGLANAKVWQFKENYRNSRHIALLALKVSKMPYFADTTDLVEPTAPTADGALPALVKCKSSKSELAFAAATAQRLGKAARVAILLDSRDQDAVLGDLLPGATRLHKKMGPWTTSPGVFYGTYAAAKGLEFDAVILPFLGASDFPAVDELATYGQKGADERAGRQLYVGLTRAKATLILTYSGQPSPLLPLEPTLFDQRQVP